MHAGGFLRRVFAAERILLRGRGFQRRHDLLHHGLAIAGADDADISQMSVARHAGHQRAELAGGGFPAADHDLMAGAALRLGPGVDAPGTVGRVALLGDDAFERQLAGGFQHRVAAGFEMLDIADHAFAVPAVQQRFQPFLAFKKRQAAQILVSGEQKIEDEEDQMIGLAVRQRGLQCREARRAVVIQRHDLAVDNGIRQFAAGFGDRRELVGPVEAFARAQNGFAILDPHLHAIAVELDLVHPVRASGRPRHRLAQLRCDEVRQLPGRSRAGVGGVARRRGRLGFRLAGCAARLRRQSLIRIPDVVRSGARSGADHERLGAAALALRDLIHRAARGDRSVQVENVVVAAFPSVFVAMLDQQPVGAFAAAAVVTHPHQHPAAMQLLAVEREFEIALLEAALGIVAAPGAAIPQLHGAAAILAFWNRAFEVAIVERMVFDLDGEALVFRIERGAAGHRP